MQLTRILVLSALCSSVAVSAQESQALFDAPVVAFPEDTSMTSVLDINGDGHMDAIGWWNFGSTVRLKGYTNDGKGGFSQRYLLLDTAPFSRYTTAALEIGQFDGSGSLDFVTRFDTDVKVYRVGSSGYPTLHASWQAMKCRTGRSRRFPRS